MCDNKELHNKDDYNEEEAKKILNALDKKQDEKNIKKLEYFHAIYLKKKQENKDLYFYRFVFYWVKHHLKDKPKKWLFFKKDILPLLFFTSLLFLIFYLIFNSSTDIINLWKEGTIKTSITFTISITIITALFFVIKIYIDNKQYKGEKEMYREMETRFDRQDDRFNKMKNEMETRFDKQDSTIDQKFSDQNSKLDSILEKITGVIAEVKNNNLNNQDSNSNNE